MVEARTFASVEHEGRTLVESLGGHWSPKGGLCRCPAHEDRSPSLSVRPGRSRLLLHCFAGCSAADVLKALAAARLLEPGAAATAGPTSSASGGAGLADAALRIWGGALELAGTPAQRYLAARSLVELSAELRYHPRAPQGPKPFTLFRPALVAAVRDGSGLVAVHRTFLDLRGRDVADRPLSRAGLGRFGQGAVRLGGLAARLGLAEGIETALSASILFGMPCWAALGTERFALVELPQTVTELHLFLDNDAGGRRAETLARGAYGETRSIEAHVPPRPGDDWNDVLRRELGLPASWAQGLSA